MLSDAYMDPRSCPRQRPLLEDMHAETIALHEGIDAAIRRSGVPYVHPDGPTLQLDLLGSRNMIAWQENKAAFTLTGDGCWSELPQVYARYGTETTRRLLEEVRRIENAQAAVLTDCGMQACALLFDVLVEPGSHAIISRQSYNKTRKYLELVCGRAGGSWTVVDDGDYAALEASVRPESCLIFAETYTNPLTRALDPDRLGTFVRDRRAAGFRRLRLVVDNTIASPWGTRRPLLEVPGIDFIVAAGTKALAGQDQDLWGYIASNDTEVLNAVMDLQAMRGGILDWRRGAAILENLPRAREHFERRCRTAAEVAGFLAAHPRVGEVFHPSLPSHPDRRTIDEQYKLPGSLLSFRLAGAGEEATRHFCDVLATCGVPRYALSFDGLATKINHHRTVSEYFTPAEELGRMGIDRLVRLGIGLENPGDLIACLNWALRWYETIGAREVEDWQRDRARDLGIYDRNASV